MTEPVRQTSGATATDDPIDADALRRRIARSQFRLEQQQKLAQVFHTVDAWISNSLLNFSASDLESAMVEMTVAFALPPGDSTVSPKKVIVTTPSMSLTLNMLESTGGDPGVDNVDSPFGKKIGIDLHAAEPAVIPGG